MQTAKNLFLWPSRDFVRKALEAWLTPQIELLWPKRRIMEVYLNVVELGPGIYGAEAAARTHFGKPASALGAEAALLVSNYHPPRLVAGPSEPLPPGRRTRSAADQPARPMLDCVRPISRRVLDEFASQPNKTCCSQGPGEGPSRNRPGNWRRYTRELFASSTIGYLLLEQYPVALVHRTWEG